MIIASSAGLAGDERLHYEGICPKGGCGYAKLLQGARDVAKGHCDADLGGGVFKQRVAREGGGRSGGFRTIILFRVDGHSFFAHGFAKNDKANVSARELKALKQLADVLIGLSDEQLRVAKAAGELIEVDDGGNKQED